MCKLPTRYIIYIILVPTLTYIVSIIFGLVGSYIFNHKKYDIHSGCLYSESECMEKIFCYLEFNKVLFWHCSLTGFIIIASIGVVVAAIAIPIIIYKYKKKWEYETIVEA